MKKIIVLGVLGVLAGCRGGPANGSSEFDSLAQQDSVEMLHAAWQIATSGHAGRRATSLYLPSSDTAAVTASEKVRSALTRRGVPAYTRRPAGDDTVVYQITRWASDSDGAPLIDLNSRWTTVLDYGGKHCRMASGNTESYRFLNASGKWSAERARGGIVRHGDAACRPIP
jgi:hypothetical protein